MSEQSSSSNATAPVVLEDEEALAPVPEEKQGYTRGVFTCAGKLEVSETSPTRERDQRRESYTPGHK